MKIRILCLTALLLSSFSASASDLEGDNLLVGICNQVTYNTYEPAKTGVFGMDNQIWGIENLVVGEANHLSYGIQTVIVGNFNIQPGNTPTPYSPTNALMVIGSNNSIGGNIDSLVVGSNQHVYTESSLVAGDSNHIAGTCQFALGYGLANHTQCDLLSIYLGQYNAVDTSENPPILVIGNGTSDSQRANALEIASDGQTKLNNNLEVYAANYNSANPNNGKIVIQPSTAGSVITLDGRALVAPSANGNLYLNPSSAGNVLLNATGSGNVGIGTNSPQAKLTVAGNAAIGTGVASAANQVAVGRYNDTRTNDNGVDHTQGVFVVGAGTGTGANAVNAIRVLNDGTVLVRKSGNLAMGTFTNGPQP